jgi:hypothetical protein
MTVRGTLALVGLLGVLLLYVGIIDRPPLPPHEERPLLAAPLAQATRVDVTWPDAALRGVRRDGGWVDAQDRVLPAGLIDDLLVALGTVRPIERVPDVGATATDYGLGARATSVVVGAAGNPLLQLEVGDRNPSWTGIYVRRLGSADVVRVGALLHWELAKLRTVATRR